MKALSPWKKRLRAALRPPRTLKVTPSGKTYLVVTVGAGIGALNTGNNLLYLVLGLLLSMVVVSGVLSERCLRDLQVRRLGTSAAFAAEPFAFRWALRRKKGNAFALSISEADVPLSGQGHLAHLAAGETESVVRADLVAMHRGPLALSGVRVSTAYPLGLFIKSRVFPLEDTLLVFPRRSLPPPARTGAMDGILAGAKERSRAGGNGDLLGLKELEDGSDSRRVHWLKSAAAGKLLQVEREREEQRIYVLNLLPGLHGEALERHCEEVAALAHQLIGEGNEVGLVTEAGRLSPAGSSAQELRILRELARAGFATA